MKIVVSDTPPHFFDLDVPTLPAAVKAGILAMVDAAKSDET